MSYCVNCGVELDATAKKNVPCATPLRTILCKKKKKMLPHLSLKPLLYPLI